MSERAARLGQAIREELSLLIQREVKDPRVKAAGLCTVTRVEVAGDLGVAKVGLSFVGGTEEQAAAAMKALGKVAGWLRGEIGRALSLRRAPELRFVHDRGGEHADLIDRLLKGDG
jgi:ribosome-binding factor A